MNPSTPTPMWGAFLSIGAAILWGVSGTFAQFLFVHRGVEAEALVGLRLLLAGTMQLLITQLIARRPIFEIWNRKDLPGLLIFSIFGMLAVQFTYFVAIKNSNAATATVLQYLGPVFIAIYLACRLRRLPTQIEGLAIGFALVGTFLLVTHGDYTVLAISTEGFFWGVASAVALASYSLLPEPLLQRYNPGVVVGWGMFVGGVSISFIYPPWNLSGSWDLPAYLSLAYIVLLGTLVAFFAYLTAIRIIGATKASVLACAEPLSAAVVAVLWLNVPFNAYDWLGTAFIVSTILILTVKPATLLDRIRKRKRVH